MSTAKENTAPTGHHALSPSKFPAWAECPCFEAGPVGEAAERGAMLHERLARHLHGRPYPFAELASEDREAVEWAAETIRGLCEGMASGDVEERLTYRRNGKGKPVFFGTADVVAFDPDGYQATVIDFKSGEPRDYRPQLAGYAAALMSEHPQIQTVVAWLLFGRHKKAWSYTFTREEAVGIVEGIIARRTDPERKPSPCDACSWCADRLTCPALVARAVVVAENREDWKGELPAEWHASSITDPDQMARALTLARFVSEWADAVKHHATELAKAGTTIPGWKIQERRGRKEIADIAEAWGLIEDTLEQPVFLRCCSLSLPKLAEAVATVAGIPKARAEREVAERLAPVTVEGKPSFSLVRERAAGGKEAA